MTSKETPPTKPGKYLIKGGYIATLDDSLGDFRTGSILIEDGTIIAVGPAESISAPDDAEILDATDSVVIPGLVDTHRHVSVSLARGLGEGQSVFPFLAETFPNTVASMGVEEMRHAAYVGALEALEGGVTTIIDTGECLENEELVEAELEGLMDSGVRAVYCVGMGEGKFGGVEEGREAWEKRMEFLDRLRDGEDEEALVRTGMHLSHPGSVPWELTAKEIRFAQERDMLCCSHSCCFKNLEATKVLEVRYENGLMLPGHVYIHCTNLTPREVELIAKTGGKVSISPEVEMAMGMGTPSIKQCIEAGIEPSLSIDNSAVVAPDLLSQARIALQMQRCLDHDAVHRRGEVVLDVEYTARDALIWATRNGAEACGLGDKIGTVTPGKRADIVVISNKRMLSASANPLGTAVLHSGPADVEMVMVDGKIRKRDGCLVGKDFEAIRRKSKECLNRILKEYDGIPKEVRSREEVRRWIQAGEEGTQQNLTRS